MQVWGAEDALYFLSGRRAASRYTYKYALLESWSRSYASSERRREFLSDVAATVPALVLVDTRDASAAELETVGLAALLARDYDPAGSAGDYLLYRRRGIQASAPAATSKSGGR